METSKRAKKKSGSYGLFCADYLSFNVDCRNINNGMLNGVNCKRAKSLTHKFNDRIMWTTELSRLRKAHNTN